MSPSAPLWLNNVFYTVMGVYGTKKEVKDQFVLYMRFVDNK